MAVKTTGTQPATAPPPASSVPATDTRPADPPADTAERPARVESDCVVDEDFHVGRAVNGKVCSYHAMHYDAAGRRRK